MKTLLKKLKNSNKFLLIYYLILILSFVVSLSLLTISLTRLTGVETIIRIIAIILFYLIWIVYIFSGAYLLILKKHKTLIGISIILTLFVPVFSYGAYFINNTMDSISGFTDKDYVTYTSVLVALKDTDITTDSKLGMINDEEDIEGYILANKLLKKENLENNEIEYYEDHFEMIRDLYEGTIDGILTSSNYVLYFSSIETYEDVETETYIVYKYSEEMKNQDIIQTSNKKLTEPFTILLMGVDGTGDGLNPNQAFNGDTLMLISVNPKTLNATVFSIPRDTYVPIACNNNTYAKINSSAARGTSCVISTVEQLTDVTIDYYVKINFKGVVDLVEALGGVTVDIEVPDYTTNQGTHCKGMVCEQDSNRRWGSNTIFIETGVQRLNGEQALAYSRNRHQYIQSDISRNKHQQQVVEALLQEAKNVDSISDFQKILNAIQKNIDTNMSTETILSFYNVGKNILGKMLKSEDEIISIEKTYMEYYSLPVYLPRAGTYTSAIGYYSDSLEAIKNALKVTLEEAQRDLIKTFSYTYGENYEQRPVGAGLRSGGTLSLLPSFVGKSKSEIESYCNTNNITCKFEDKEATGADVFYPNGYIVSQSVHQGVLVKEISSITFYTNKITNTTTPNNNTEPNPNNNPSNECDPNDISCNTNPLNPSSNENNTGENEGT